MPGRKESEGRKEGERRREGRKKGRVTEGRKKA
jgi:hypothetical protein